MAPQTLSTKGKRVWYPITLHLGHFVNVIRKFSSYGSDKAKPLG